MKNILDSLLLSFQFFTAVPVHKELPLTRRTVTGMLSFLPWTGALGGVIAMFLAYIMSTQSEWSALLISFVIVVTMAIFTGGLHLDGLTDTGDAYFSHRDTERRLEILEDPRVGAFGVFTILFLLIGKLIVLQELLLLDEPPFWAIAFIPLLARVGMGVYFVLTSCAKEKGLGYFFKGHTNAKLLFVTSILTSMLSICIIFYVFDVWVAPVILTFAIVLLIFLYRRWTLKNFRGVSGDLLGAFIEGVDFVLWIILLLFI